MRRIGGVLMLCGLLSAQEPRTQDENAVTASCWRSGPSTPLTASIAVRLGLTSVGAATENEMKATPVWHRNCALAHDRGADLRSCV